MVLRTKLPLNIELEELLDYVDNDPIVYAVYESIYMGSSRLSMVPLLSMIPSVLIKIDGSMNFIKRVSGEVEETSPGLLNSTNISISRFSKLVTIQVKFIY